MNHNKFVDKCTSKYADGGVVGSAKSALGLSSDAQKKVTAEMNARGENSMGEKRADPFSRSRERRSEAKKSRIDNIIDDAESPPQPK